MTPAEVQELKDLAEQLIKLIETAQRLACKSDRRTAFQEIGQYRDRLNRLTAAATSTRPYGCDWECRKAGEK